MARITPKLLSKVLDGVRRYSSSIAFKAGLVCICCYLGSAFDSAVVYPRINTAILFPSYAVLTATLLLSPMREWWIFLLASALGNYLPHRADSPMSWVLLAEGANLTRALLAAIGVRCVTPEGPRFDTLRGVAAYLAFAVVAGPFVAAFMGAGVVVMHLTSTDFWQVWRAWFLSNALTGLTLLPLIMIGIQNVADWNWLPNWRRCLELGTLVVGLLLVAILVFASPYTGTNSLPARLYAPLPFLLWAAVRFGPGGTSISILAITVLAIWGVLHESGPFVTQSPAENLLSLQLFLLAISLPLMFLAAVMAERGHAFAALSNSEQEVRRQFAQLATIYRSAPIGLGFVDSQLRYVGVNDYLADVNGLPAQAHQGRTIREVLPQLADTIEPLYRRVLATGEPVVDMERHGITASKPGSERYWIFSYYPVKDMQGAVFGVSTVVQETTQRKEADDARRELAHASRLALVGELTASIAHEINQPLGAILSNADAAEMLLDSKPAPLDEVRQILSDIRKDDIRASDVIRRIRTLLQKRETEPESLNLNDEVTEVLGFLHAEANRRDIAVETTLAANLPPIRCDKIQLQQVLLNLLLNGMESMTEVVGTKRLFVNTCLYDNNKATIAITDIGTGIPPHQIPRLFQPFFSTKKKGMGLGLSIARSLVEAHGGSIWAENNAGRGATFRLTVPIERHETSQDLPTQERAIAELPN